LIELTAFAKHEEPMSTVVNPRAQFPGEEPVGVFTWRSMSVSTVAACGGLLFGYDLGITGKWCKRLLAVY
jgi:hypothetical protein